MNCVRCLCVMLCSVASCLAQKYVTLHSGTSENLRGVSAVSKDVVWASGTHGTYLRSTDAGKTWLVAQVPGAETLDFRDVEAFSDREAYLLSAGPGEQSRIYKTIDAGQRWTLQFTNRDPAGFLDCMAFWDESHGIVVGDPVGGRFELLTTSNAGQTWKSLADASRPAAQAGEGAFAASGTCVAVHGRDQVWFASGGKVARVFQSSDRGEHWTVADAPLLQGKDSSGTFSIAFRDAQHGIIVGGDYRSPDDSGKNVATTKDGGATWQLSRITPQSYFSAASWNGEKVLVAGSNTLSYGTPSQQRWSVHWNLKLNALSGFYQGRAYAVGPAGLIVAFQDKGR